MNCLLRTLKIDEKYSPKNLGLYLFFKASNKQLFKLFGLFDDKITARDLSDATKFQILKNFFRGLPIHVKSVADFCDVDFFVLDKKLRTLFKTERQQILIEDVNKLKIFFDFFHQFVGRHFDKQLFAFFLHDFFKLKKLVRRLVSFFNKSVSQIFHISFIAQFARKNKH